MSAELINSGPFDLLFFPDAKNCECFPKSFNFATRGQYVYYHVS